MRRTFALLAGLILAAGCGGGGPATTTTVAATSTTSATPTTTTAPDSTTLPVDADATITISGFAFGEPLTVTVGDTVAVVNQDGVPHTWTSDDGLFDSGSLSRGEVFRHTFTEAGEYEFFCGIHPQMQGSITVQG